MSRSTDIQAVVFIDSRVPDLQDLLDGLMPGELAFVLDSASDGVAQIAAILAANDLDDLSAISIVAHGASGELQLGATELDESDLADHAPALAAIGAALAPGGDLQFYACDVASGASGQQFIADLSHFTGAEVAAATHLVGSADLGGSFTLDATTGPIEAAAPFIDTALAQFEGTLGSVTAFNNDQPSLALTQGIISQGIFPPTGDGGTADIGGVPMGAILTFAGNYAIGGTFLAQAQLLPIQQYQAFFSILGTTYGGDGRTTFGMPDLQGRTIVGAGLSPGLNSQSLGEQSGSDTVTLAQNQMPAGFGGAGLPFNNDGPSLAINYLVNTAGTADGSEGDDLLGAVIPFAGNFAPDGYLPADGRLLDTTTYAPLFNLIHYTYGGSGSEFALPDLRGRTIVGASATHPLGDIFGQDETSLSSADLPTSAGGQGTAISNFGPSVALNYIIDLYGIYPAQNGGPIAGEGNEVLGEVLAYLGSSAPADWALAQGARVDISQDEALYSIVGTIYGGDGDTYFNLPDLRDRTVVGTGTSPALGSVTIGQTYGSSSITLSTSNIYDAAPTLSVSSTAASTEQTPAGISGSASVSDANLNALTSGNGNYAGASVTIARDGGAHAEDGFGFSTSGASFTVSGTVSGGDLQSGGKTFATYTNTSGTLTINFTGSQTVATTSLVDNVLQHITYADQTDNPDSSVPLDWTFSDGNAGGQGATPTPGQYIASTTESITAVNDAPTLTVPATASYAEGDSPVVLAPAATVTDPDGGSGYSATVQITGGFVAGDELSGSGSYNPSTHTFTTTLASTATMAALQAVLQTVTFDSTSDDPRNAQRTLTWTISDGSSQNPTSTTTTTVSVTPVNDAPVLTPDSPTLTAVAADNFSSSGQKISAILGSSDNDPDDASAPRGIAVTGETETGGTWQYSLDNGSTWTNVPTDVAESAALVLQDSDSIRFLPDGSRTTGTETLTYRAWDQTDGSTHGTQVDITTTGGVTAFSDASDTASLSVTPDVTPPKLGSIVASDATLTNAAMVSYTVTFSEAVTGVNARQFSVATTGGVTGANIQSVSGSGTTYTVTVNTGSGDGTVALDLIGAGIDDAAGNPYPGGTFAPKADYATGATPADIAVADINRDGILDLVTANRTAGTVSALLGDGDGTFGVWGQTATDSDPEAVAVADVDGDGIPDIVSANFASQSVSVLLGFGNGAFQTAKNFSDTQLGGISDVAMGDFNEDGHPDIADTHGATSGKVAILLGTGTASLFPASPSRSISLDTTSRSTKPIELATADLNGDGHLDLAVLDSGNRVLVLPGNGNGTFGAFSAFNVGQAPDAIAIGDLNGDGTADIVTGNVNSHSITVLINNGSGGFSRHDTGLSAPNEPAAAPLSLSVGDFNNDGKQDVAAVINSGVLVLFGNGDGTFQSGVQYSAETSFASVAAGDLDSDGRTDLAAASLSSSDASVLLNLPASVQGSAYTIDKTAPDTTITGDPGATSGADVSFTFSGTDAGGSGVGSYNVSLDGAAPSNTTDTTADYTGLAHGAHSFSVAAVDPVGNIDPTPDTFNWVVDQPPVANNETYSVDAGSSLTVDAAAGVLANDTDADGDSFTAAFRANPVQQHGTLTFNLDGSFTYTPNAGFHGTDSFGYQVSDGLAESNVGIVTITVNDRAPVANPDAVATDEATVLAGNLFADNGSGPDSDPDGDAFSVIKINGVAVTQGAPITLASGALLTITDVATGAFTYDPNHKFDSLPDSASGASNLTKDDSFNYTITGGSTGTVAVTVSGLDSNDTLADLPGFNDILRGGVGNDAYFVNDAGDHVIENPGEGTDTVYASVSYTKPANVEALILTGTGSTATGSGGTDSFGGIGGPNTFVGLGGNDTYYVHNGDDKVVEQPGADGGIDRVIADLDYTMPDNVEALILNGADLTGTGTGGNDTFGGIGGPNTFIGLGGNDIYYVHNSDDTVVEQSGVGSGVDRVIADVDYTMPGNIEALLLSGSGHTAHGTSGSDSFGEYGGPNTFAGGDGNDVYYVHNSADVVQEDASHGADRVIADVDYTMPANVEALVILGSGLTAHGTAGDDTFGDVGGPDTFVGGDGNDTYYVHNSGDIVQETTGGGSRDVVVADVDYVLTAGSDIEVLMTSNTAGSNSLDLTGNALGQTIVGNAGSNVIDGGSGNDTLEGLGGDDTFVFDTALSATTNIDRIVDFAHGADQIELDHAVFTALTPGVLDAADFTTAAPATADQHILYNTTTGALSYDSDGNGTDEAAVQFATLITHPALLHDDIIVV